MVTESGRNALCEGVGRDVGERDEEGPLDEEDPCGRQREDPVLEDAPIGPDGLRDATVVGWSEAAADEQVGDAQEEEGVECEDPRGPFEAHFREEALEHQWEDDAAGAAAGAGETGSRSAAFVEEMRYRADCRGEDEGGADTAEDGVCQDEMP